MCLSLLIYKVQVITAPTLQACELIHAQHFKQYLAGHKYSTNAYYYYQECIFLWSEAHVPTSSSTWGGVEVVGETFAGGFNVFHGELDGVLHHPFCHS